MPAPAGFPPGKRPLGWAGRSASRRQTLHRVGASGKPPLPSAPVGADEPLDALAALHRPRRGPALEDGEPGRENPLHFGPGNRKRRPVGALKHGVEAGEQDPAGTENRVEEPHIFLPAARVDGAEARVLPDAVEEAAIILIERKDIAPLHDHAKGLAGGQPARLGYRGFGEVESPDAISAAGEEPGVMSTAATGDGDPSGLGGDTGGEGSAGIEPRLQRRSGRADLPAVISARIELLPEGGRAYGRASALHSSPSKSAMAASAPAARSSSSVCAVVTPMARMPALRAAWMPTTESSNTTHAAGAARIRRAASTYTSGSGLPSLTSSAVTMTSKCCRSPRSSRSRSQSKREAEVPTARGTPSRPSAMTKAAAPGTTASPRRASET